MKKINKFFGIIILIVAVLVLFGVVSSVKITATTNTTNSTNNSLFITKVTAWVGSEKDTITNNGDTINEDAKPGDKIKLKIEIENRHATMQMEDVDVELTVYDLDEGDDIEEDESIDEIDEDDSETVTFEFDVPYAVEEDKYKITIDVEGEDEEGKKHKDSWDIFLDVDKKKHEVIIERSYLDSNKVSCRNSIDLNLVITNIGTEDEDKAFYNIKFDALSLNIHEEFELDEGDDHDDISINRFVPINIEKLKPATYTINIEAGYDIDRVTDTKTLSFTKEQCKESSPVKEENKTTTPPKEEKEDDFFSKIQYYPPIIVQEQPQQQDGTIIWLIVGCIIVAVLIIIITALLLRR